MGTSGRVIGCSDHQSSPARLSVVKSYGLKTRSAGHTAPVAIQELSRATSASVSRGPLSAGGISPLRTRSKSGLSSGFPATIAAPLSPPASTWSRLVRLSPPAGSAPAWHPRQRETSSGAISLPKLTAVAASIVAADGVASSAHDCPHQRYRRAPRDQHCWRELSSQAELGETGHADLEGGMRAGFPAGCQRPRTIVIRFPCQGGILKVLGTPSDDNKILTTPRNRNNLSAISVAAPVRPGFLDCRSAKMLVSL